MAVPSPEGPPSEEECRALVKRILASPQFQRATRLRDFLTYVVDRQFAGAADEMTEAIIGHRVFHRPATYNPGEDSIVRTEARSLRQRLDQYYTDQGAAERILLTIPKGAYVPVFVHRPRVGARSRRPRRRLWLIAAAALAVCAAAAFLLVATRSGPARQAGGTAPPPVGAVRLSSSDRELETRFEQARRQALRYVYEGDSVGSWYAGNWYEDRYAFYMRDVAHQSAGAAVLGLARQSRNMLRLFASSVAFSRRWCSFWGINKDGFPTPIDYQSDSNFYYCLPANFDVLRACYEQYLWTGDETYFDAAFSSFYDRTVMDYVSTWDRDADGLVESRMEDRGVRGRASYNQSGTMPATGADMVAAQYRGYIAYARLQEHKGASGSLSHRVAEQYRAKAEQLRIRYNTAWWDAEGKQYYSMLLPDKTYSSGYTVEACLFPLLFGITEEGARTAGVLDRMIAQSSIDEPPLSYFPEVLFRYGRNDAAYRFLTLISAPSFASHRMPEIAFATVGATVNGLMGVEADAPARSVETMPHLPQGMDWVRLDRLPVLHNEIEVLHRGVTETALSNQSGPPLQWKACFPAGSPSAAARLVVDGAPMEAAAERRGNGQPVLCVTLPVKPGQTRVAKKASVS